MKKNSRAKGNSFELQVAKAFSQHFGCKFRRTPLSGGWSEKAETKGDIVCVDRDDFPYCVECKNAEGWHLESLFTDKHEWFDAWWLQVTSECPEGKVPLLVFTRNFCPAFAAVKYHDWMSMLQNYSDTIDTVLQMTRPDDIVILRFDMMLLDLKWNYD
jgi:hypothetical protein